MLLCARDQYHRVPGCAKPTGVKVSDRGDIGRKTEPATALGSLPGSQRSCKVPDIKHAREKFAGDHMNTATRILAFAGVDYLAAAGIGSGWAIVAVGILSVTGPSRVATTQPLSASAGVS